jgi:hypothetical protein
MTCQGHFQLAETEGLFCSGICPRCKKPWASDPHRECDCNRGVSSTTLIRPEEITAEVTAALANVRPVEAPRLLALAK